jgi:hypothetical protein
LLFVVKLNTDPTNYVGIRDDFQIAVECDLVILFILNLQST